jgi:metal-responsive CopG/Arc/MetJ family transcriptional regulator
MKVAISLPDPVFNAAERLAGQLKVSRSQLYAEALAVYLSSRGATAVTEQLNAVYGAESSGVDLQLSRAQARAIGHEAW